MIRTLWASGVLLCAFGVELRGSQQVDILQPLELAVQLFGQSFDTAVQAFENRLITLLYPNNATEVQSQIDQCESDFWCTEVTNLQELGRDVQSLASVCNSDDPSDPALQLMNDAISLISAVVADCDALSVDLQNDIARFLAGLMIQGVQLARPIFGSTAQLLAGGLPPFNVSPLFRAFVANWFALMGSPPEPIENTERNGDALIADFDQVQAEIAREALPLSEDVAAAMMDPLQLAGTDSVIFGAIFRNSVQYITPFVQTMCSFAGPLLSAPSS